MESHPSPSVKPSTPKNWLCGWRSEQLSHPWKFRDLCLAHLSTGPRPRMVTHIPMVSEVHLLEPWKVSCIGPMSLASLVLVEDPEPLSVSTISLTDHLQKSWKKRELCFDVRCTHTLFQLLPPTLSLFFCPVENLVATHNSFFQNSENLLLFAICNHFVIVSPTRM